MYTERTIALKHLNVSTELLRNIAYNNLHLLQLLKPKSCILLFIVLSEMLNILRVSQVRLGGIITMVLLKVVNLVLILNIAMVSGTEAKVGQPFTRSIAVQPVLAGDESCVARVEECKYCAHSILFLIFTNGGIGLVVQAVCLAYFVVGPCSGRVVVMKNEERGRVEGFDVMLLCG